MENQNNTSETIDKAAATGAVNQPLLLTTDEVAILLRKSRRTIEHWVKAGYIGCIKIQRSVLFNREQVLRDVSRFQTNGQ